MFEKVIETNEAGDDVGKEVEVAGGGGAYIGVGTISGNP